MNDADAEALRWLQFSNRDLSVASQLLRGATPAPHHVCWLCQQSAEKALKAVLTSEEIDFPLTHDLDRLMSKLPEGWPVRDVSVDLGELTQWVVEARYPGGWPEPTNADAVRAESDARLIYSSVAAEFRRRGTLI